MKSIFSFYYFIYYVAAATSFPFLTLYLHGKGLNSTQIGVLLSAGSAVAILAQPILGFINDRSHRPRRILILSTVLAPIVYAGYTFFHSFWPLLGVAVVLAVVQSAGPIMDAITVKAGERYQFTFGQIRLWGALGWAVTTVGAGYVFHLIGYGASFAVYGVLSVVTVVAILLLPRDDTPVHSAENIAQGIVNVMKHKILMVFIGICFLLSLTSSIHSNFFPLYYQNLHYPMGWFGLTFTVAASVEVPIFLLSGPMMARFGVMPILILGAVLYPLKYVLLALEPGAAIVIASQVFDGMGFALTFSASVQMVIDLAPEGRLATSQTLYSALAGGLSSIIGTTVGGWVFDAYGPIIMYWSIAIVGGIAVLAFVMFARLRSRRHASTPALQVSS